jgi:hypothetical protein
VTRLLKGQRQGEQRVQVQHPVRDIKLGKEICEIREGDKAKAGLPHPA